MPSFVEKAINTFFGRLLQIDQTGNTGIDETTRHVQDGFGNNSAFSLSDDVVGIQPENDDTVNTVLVRTQAGSNVLKVDTTNSKVLVGASQVAATTQEKIFAVFELSPVAGTHYSMATQPGLISQDANSDWSSWAGGTGTNPNTSVTINTVQEFVIPTYWFVSSNITIDEVRVLAGCDDASTLNFHLMSFSVVTGSGSTAGDLSSGVYNATTGTTDPDSLSPITVGDDRIATSTLTIENADVDSGKVILAFVENVGGTDDVTAQLIVKYHIR